MALPKTTLRTRVWREGWMCVFNLFFDFNGARRQRVYVKGRERKRVISISIDIYRYPSC